MTTSDDAPTNYYVSYSVAGPGGMGFGWGFVTMPKPVKTKQHLDHMHQMVRGDNLASVVVISFQPL